MKRFLIAIHAFLVVTIFQMMPTFGRAADQLKKRVQMGSLTATPSEISIERNSSIVWRQRFKRTAEKNELVQIEIAPLKKDVQGILVTVFSGDRPVFKWAGLRRAKKDKLRNLWQGSVIRKGDLGQQSGPDIHLFGPTGTGYHTMVLGVASDEVRMCGVSEAPTIFGRALNLATGKFTEETLITPLNDANVSIEASPPFSQRPLPLLIPRSTSWQKGADTPLLLTPPYALVDGRSETFWDTGKRNGGTEFATFDTVSAALGLSFIQLTTTQPAKGVVVLKTADRDFNLKLDGQSRNARFVLPQPIHSSCLSFLPRQLVTADGKAAYLAEIQAYTHPSPKTELTQMVTNLGDAQLGEPALVLLRAMGADVYDPVDRLWDKLGPKGQRRAVRLFADVAPKKGAGRLAKAALGNDAPLAAIAQKGLIKAGSAGTHALLPYLNPQIPLFDKALRLTAKLNTDDGFQSLLSLVGSGNRTQRTRLIETVAQLTNTGSRQDRLMKLVWQKIDENKLVPAADLLFVAIKVIKQKDAPLAAALKLVELATDFNTQYLSLLVLGKIKSAAALKTLLSHVQDDDPYIRSIVFDGLHHQEKSEAVNTALLSGLSDTSVMVRLSVLNQLQSGVIAKQFHQPIIRLIDDPWPQVRVLTLLGAAKMGSFGAKLLKRGIQDKNQTVQKTAIDQVIATRPKGMGPAIRAVLSHPQTAPSVLQRAAVAVGTLCLADHQTTLTLGQLLQKGAEPLADKAQVRVALAAANALGQLGTTQAHKILIKTGHRTNPAVGQAIKAALNHSPRCLQ